ncbi:MAG: PEP-CTERM sorting domain-containing protein [Sphingomonas sp.]|nr:PEP-CTERM sorting domain-containing protein [Sphingomonas sp.]
MRIKLFALAAAAIACAVGGPVQAANLLVNGDFELISMTNGLAEHSTLFGTVSADLPTVTGWTTDGYNFVMKDNPGYGGSTATGADDYFDGAYTTGTGDRGFSLWGPDSLSSPSMNGLTNSPVTATGGGGNFIAADGAYLNRPIEQVLNNLEIGRQYHLSFAWAAAQQENFDGATTEGWTVYENMTFTATATTQTLSLLAYGTPIGQPPFALIDNVNLSVPEPSTWAMMLLGFGLVGGVMRTRRQPLTGRRALNAQII